MLFATDFSAASEPAGRVATETGRSFGARLYAVHVVRPVADASTAAEQVAATARAEPARASAGAGVGVGDGD